ncbi:MAG: SPOR domain-containing protein [Ectothiorhodospiraceae bacterium AqS1]|nr:SPOR domain-containing protein [Ectothiorhodospiraceae bacterium AqS1]
MAGQVKGAVKRPRHIVGGSGTTLFLAGMAVGCLLTWSMQSPESIPNPLRASYQERAGVEQSAFPPSPTYEFYTVLPEGGADPSAQTKPLVVALDDAQEDGDQGENSNGDTSVDSNADSGDQPSNDAADEPADEDDAADEPSPPEPSSPEASLQDLKASAPSPPSGQLSEPSALSAEEALSAAPDTAAAQELQVLPPEPVEDPPAIAATFEPSEEATLASIRKAEDDPAAVAPSRYVIQVGSFKEASEVEKTKASLILMGFRVMVQSLSIDGGTPWHRVRVGPFESLSQTENARDRLESEGFKAIVLKGQRG